MFPCLRFLSNCAVEFDFLETQNIIFKSQALNFFWPSIGVEHEGNFFIAFIVIVKFYRS